jgi:hypothetical protein
MEDLGEISDHCLKKVEQILGDIHSWTDPDCRF